MSGLENKRKYESEAFRREKEAPGATLGALYTPEETWFRVWVPEADEVTVRLYKTGTPEEAEDKQGFLRSIPMKPSLREGESSVWEAIVPGDLHSVYYTYGICRAGVWKECVDPYTRACGADGVRGMVVDLKRTDPEGWEADTCFRADINTVICELHVKDFSCHQSSGIPHEHRGKYLAFTDSTGRNTGVEYLKRLGISHVHLLPIFDFSSVRETGDEDQFNWGYDPLNYNVPEGSYATDARHGEVRILECKSMIQALHKAGIGVVMDVVYNHTAGLDNGFQATAPDYFYRQNSDGSLSNGSDCGNETASERVMCGKFIRESVIYWAEEYHIDGFRFDLMGLHDTETMNSIRKALDERFPDKHILIYGEPWAASASPMEPGFFPAVKANVDKLSPDIAIFSDDTRDTIKGSVFFGEEPGFVNGGRGLEPGMASAWCAWCDGGHEFTPVTPGQIISYVSVHDNYTLWDKLVLTQRAAERGKADYGEKKPQLLAMNQLTAGILFTMLGTPLFQAGEEFGRTKYGDENSYQSSPSINCLDWDRCRDFSGLTEYYRGLISLRAQIPLYRQQSLKAVQAVHIMTAKDQVVEVCLDLEEYPCRWRKIYIVANASHISKATALPKGGRYQKLVDEKSSWLWKRAGLWSKIKKAEQIVETSPVSIGIWGELR